MIEESTGLRPCHFLGMTQLMKEDIATNPVAVDADGCRKIALPLHDQRDLIQQFWLLRQRLMGRRGGWFVHSVLLFLGSM
jgi:hypothetical protein